jgi:hypothetical protein
VQGAGDGVARHLSQAAQGGRPHNLRQVAQLLQVGGLALASRQPLQRRQNPGRALFTGLGTTGGWRWANVNIPAGSIITSAWVRLQQAGFGNILVTTLAFDNRPAPPTFTRPDSPAVRWANHTTWTLPWQWDTTNDPPNRPHVTPELKDGIQELVDRFGGIQHLALLENGDGVAPGVHHNWRSFEQDPTLAAELHIEYLAP